MLKVDIADTPSSLEKGLMFVENMPDDEGMLFVFRQPHKLSFWGRNTFIPLDIAFITRDNKIAKISRIKPFDLKMVSSEKDCVMAVEANAGYFERNGIKEGDEIVIETDDWRKKANLEFRRNEGKSPESKNIKESQVSPVPAVPVPPKNEPVAAPPPQEDESQLPVLGPDEISKILEDSYDEPELPPEQEQLPEPEEKPETKKEYPTFANVFDALSWAEQEREVVRISYVTKSGRQLSRDIEPHGQFHADSTMHQIEVCFDQTVNDIRAFIMTNIQNWAFVGKQFQKKFVVRA